MKNYKLILLTALTIVVMIVAGIFVNSRAPQATKEKNLLFPGLSSQLDDVAHIQIQGYDESISLSRQGNIWVIDDFDGYPALLDKVKSTVIGVSELRIVAPKTASARLYHRLGVEGPDIEDSPSLRLILKDNSDKILADLIVGSQRKSRAAENKPGLYIRLTGSKQSYLVEGLLDITSRKTDWFERTLFDIPSANISKIEITHSDGDTYTVFKTDKGQDDFELKPIPAGKKQTSVIILNKFGSLLQDFHSSGVRSATSISEPNENIDAVVTTFEGLIARIHAFELDDIAYARFRFEFDENLMAKTEDDKQIDSQNFKQLADNLNQKLEGWIFEIPEFKYDVIKKKSVRLLIDASIEDELEEDL